MKFMTHGEAETKRHKAVDFLRRIGNDDLADEFEGMTADEYAKRKGVELIANPNRSHTTMPRGKSKNELQGELDEANERIEELEAKLDDIAGLATEDEDEDEDEELDDGDEDD